MAGVRRSSNIEALRILAIIGVMVLHYNNPVIGGGITYAQEGSPNFYVLYVLESLFACGVDLFVLISGYFMCESRTRNLWKPIELVIQVMLFREGIYCLRVLLRVVPFSLKTAITTLLPVNYFVILYCVVYLLSPYINLMVDNLSVRSFRNLMTITICIFAVYPTLVDVLGELRGGEFIGLSTVGMYGSQWGYSAVNFLLMYLIGSYMKRGAPKISGWPVNKLLISLAASITIMVIWARINDKIGFFTERSAWEYCNPVLIFEAVVIFVLFTKIDIGVNPVINKLADGVFSVFLLHQFFIPYLQIEKYVSGSLPLMIAHMFMSVIIIYGVCSVAHLAYHAIMNPVFNVLSKNISLPVIKAESRSGDQR